jgi:ParB family transcriptional regulator, chromosome partitioning protein
MSETTHSQKQPIKGAKGLGRGLGSLLSGEDGAFAKNSPGADKTLQALTEKLPSQKDPAIQQGFIETKSPAPQPAPAVPNHLRIWQVAIEKIAANPNQPRQVFDKEPLQELANSIHEKGIIQPLLLRKKGEGFEIIAGERRWRAAQIAGLKEVPALIKESEDQEVLELALIENIQRENLNPIEEAEAYDFLIKKYNLTQQDLAQKVGKERATVANLLRLLGLDPAVRQMVSNKELSLGQAKVLLAITEGKQQQAMAERARKESLSVRALEKLVAKPKLEAVALEPNEDEQLRSMLAKDLGEEIQKLIGSKVVLDYDKGKGKIAISFYTDAELNQIADRLRKSWQQS